MIGQTEDVDRRAILVEVAADTGEHALAIARRGTRSGGAPPRRERSGHRSRPMEGSDWTRRHPCLAVKALSIAISGLEKRSTLRESGLHGIQGPRGAGASARALVGRDRGVVPEAGGRLDAAHPRRGAGARRSPAIGASPGRGSDAQPHHCRGRLRLAPRGGLGGTARGSSTRVSPTSPVVLAARPPPERPRSCRARSSTCSGDEDHGLVDFAVGAPCRSPAWRSTISSCHARNTRPPWRTATTIRSACPRCERRSRRPTRQPVSRPTPDRCW